MEDLEAVLDGFGRIILAETEPLKDFYEKLGVLKLVEGNQPIEAATRDILAALGV